MVSKRKAGVGVGNLWRRKHWFRLCHFRSANPCRIYRMAQGIYGLLNTAAFHGSYLLVFSADAPKPANAKTSTFRDKLKVYKSSNLIWVFSLFYFMNRHDEGFGLNMEAVDEMAERGAKLIITVDCGTADIKEVAKANKKGMEVIITDHHESSKLPKAYAIVNPKRKDSTYPFNPPAGGLLWSGLSLQTSSSNFMKEESASWRIGIKTGQEKWSLDMVGIATLSDMVPLVGENRILAKFGLDVLRKSPRPGLSALFNKLKIEQRF